MAGNHKNRTATGTATRTATGTATGTATRIAAVCALSLLLAFGTTTAYLSYLQKQHNAFTVGRNTIAVTEEYAPPMEMKQGDNLYQKKVQVKNTGTVPCFVRVFAGFSDREMEERSQLSPDGAKLYPAAEYAAHLPDGWSCIEPEEDVLLGGYYYFTEAVEPKQETIPLFEKVNTHFERAEDVSAYEILIYAESVQVRDLDGVEFAGADAWRQAWTQFLERRRGE